MKLLTVKGFKNPGAYIGPLDRMIPTTSWGHRRAEILRFASSVNNLAFSSRSARRCCEGEVCRVMSLGGPPEGCPGPV